MALPWWLGWPCFVALLSVRLLAAATAPIMDCDETFNYWEPLHYLLRGTGMQTWEYSPEFALRSWVYIELHAVALRLLPASLVSGASAFWALRQCLALLCAQSEALFCRAVGRRFGARPALLVLVFSGASSGMFHAGVALLPSTTCMYCVLLGHAAWLSDQHRLGLLCGCFAVLLAWPFVAPMFVPMGLHALAVLGLRPVLACAVQGLLLFGLLPALFDGYAYYGAARPVSAVGNLLLYNVAGSGGGGEGANLYGVEGPAFYPRNLLLNFNLVAPLGLGSAGLVLLLLPAARAYTRGAALLYLSGMYAAFAVFQSMAHKVRLASAQYHLPLPPPPSLTTAHAPQEERFLTMIYPALCLGAALALDAALAALADGVAAPTHGAARRALARVARAGAVAAVALFVALSASRSLALVRYYVRRTPLHSRRPGLSAPSQRLTRPRRPAPALTSPACAVQGAPFAAYAALPPDATRVCVGKEWYRFPSSFFLPPSAPPLLFVKSGFGGQLPRPFAPWPQGLSEVPPHMNDANKEEPSRYSALKECAHVVDLDLDAQAEPSVVRDAGGAWERVRCAPFLDAAASTSTLARAFYVPGLSDKRNVYAEYCLVRRR